MRSRSALPRIPVFAAGLALVCSVSACGNNSSTPEAASQPTTATATTTTTSTPPTLTASKLQPPSQDNEYAESSGRPKVVFDPCTWVPDSAVSSLGLDPSTRERGNDMVAEYTFLTCDVSNQDESLQLDSGNVTLDEVRKKYAGRTQDMSINGRNAVLTPNKTASDDCSIDMETKAGYFGVTVIVSTPGGLKGMKPCDNIVHIAETLEPYIGEGN
ncbi:DUF3558 domain-containing protein [Nocardia vermiculata]|uniref:DUF3558 domain-containing protein n=1 Tax=Nocardia vermiculata TaxID=257274 RepID=A0A846Y7D6_9NOCA|nr:DUF3558 domain-containing protein [Nocardia vermiculata]NKY53631.1 DUF3558 domain-containing protein [Nocardia vermiculata]